jgi:thiosulfate/3-mercaptopyruvate sulfurtransferase
MNLSLRFRIFLVLSVASLTISAALAFQASQIAPSHTISIDDLVKILQSSKGDKPLLIHVGSHVLYSQAHIPNSEYIGPASDPAALQRLRTRVESLPRNKFIVLYCGCCPWTHCPNMKPADDLLHSMAFTNVKSLEIPDNFGTDWVTKGYPVAKGE